MHLPPAQSRRTPYPSRPGTGTSDVRAIAAAGDDPREARLHEFLGDDFSALRAKFQSDRLAINRDIRFEQSRRTARAMQAPVILASRPYGAAGDELNNGRARKLSGLIVRRKIPAKTSSDLRQRVREPSEPARFATLPHVFPLRVIAVLQASGSIAPDGLQTYRRPSRCANTMACGVAPFRDLPVRRPRPISLAAASVTPHRPRFRIRQNWNARRID